LVRPLLVLVLSSVRPLLNLLLLRRWSNEDWIKWSFSGSVWGGWHIVLRRITWLHIILVFHWLVHHVTGRRTPSCDKELCKSFFVLCAVISIHTRHGMTMGSPGMERP